MLRQHAAGVHDERRVAERRERVFRVLHLLGGDGHLCREHGRELRRWQRVHLR
jgi:hypothetical protein